MVTVSHLTKKILKEKPYINEFLEEGIINIVALAERIKPQIEKELGNVKTSAVSMAIRRYLESDNKARYRHISLAGKTNLILKSDLFELSILKSPKLNGKLTKLYEIVNFEEGDTLNIIQGNYETLIIADSKNSKKILSKLKEERIKNKLFDLSSISLKIPEELISIPGFYYTITKTLAMEGIPIIDIVNTRNESSFILEDKYVTRAYEILKSELKISHLSMD